MARKSSKRKFSPAQIAAQKRFAAMARERAKTARGRKRNTTVIKARTIKRLTVSKAPNGRRRNPFDTSQKLIPLSDAELSAKYSAAKTEYKGMEKAKRAALAAFNQMDATVAEAWKQGRPPQSLLDSYVAAKTHFEQTYRHAARLDEWIAKAVEELKRRRTKRNPAHRNNEKRDSDHPIEVVKHWRAGPPGYLTPWQRAHAAGQKQLFDTGIQPARHRNKRSVIKRNSSAKLNPQQIRRQVREHIRAGRRQAEILKLMRQAGFPQKYLDEVKRIYYGEKRDLDRIRTGRRSTELTMAERAMERKQTARNPKRKRKSNGTVSKLRATHALFTGRPCTKTTEMHAPNGTPKRLVKLGRVVKLQTRRVTIKPSHRNPASTVWLCADTKGKLHLCSTNPRLIDGPKRDFGQVVEIEYATAKPHLGHPDTTRFFHQMGEEGGRKPTLIADGQGGLKLVGGDYRITREGLEN